MDRAVKENLTEILFGGVTATIIYLINTELNKSGIVLLWNYCLASITVEKLHLQAWVNVWREQTLVLAWQQILHLKRRLQTTIVTF